MDLQLLASEIANTDEVYKPIKEIYNSVIGIREVKTEQDIDNLSKILFSQERGIHLSLDEINVNNMLNACQFY